MKNVISESVHRWLPKVSVRAALRATTLTLAALVLITMVSLVALAKRLDLLASRMHDAVENVHATEELEVNLLLHVRMKYGTGRAASSPAELARLDNDLRSWLDLAHRHVTSAEESALDGEARRHIETYLETAATESEQPPAAMEDALRVLETLVDHNVMQAQAYEQEADRWIAVADIAAAAVSLALIVVVVALLAAAQRLVYRPLVEVHDAIRSFRDGDASSRATEIAPRELAEIARTFNETASALVRQREMQLTFLAGVAHDLRNPLSALRLNAARIAPDRPLPSEERIRNMFELLARQVDRLDRMVGDLLDASRIEAGQFELRLEVRDVRSVIHETAELYSTTSHDLRVDAPGEPVLVECDPARLSQVMNNLVSNAMKYSPAGTRIDIAIKCIEEQAEIAVIDQGRGIAPEEVETIFEPFRRGSGIRDILPGAGLGLSVAKRIVEAHGGRMGVESTVGEGSTFRVLIPRRSAAKVAAA